MDDGGYTDLRLTFKHAGGRTYEVLAEADGARPRTAIFEMPLSDVELAATLAGIRAFRKASKSRSITAVADPVPEPPAPDVVGFGEQLADALLTGEVHQLFDELYRAGPVRLRLNMTEQPELLQIPWEFLRRDGKYLAGQQDSTIVRELSTTASNRVTAIDGKIRMLGVIANPKGPNELNVERERERVEAAVRRCSSRIDLEWLTKCTKQELRRVLADERFDIIHFIGHGKFDAENGSVLFLENDDGELDERPADEIAQVIATQRSVQLVVLNSCEGAQTSADNPFMGMATILIHQGLSAVIANQFEITDDSATRFAEELYFALIDRSEPIDAAVARARQAVMDNQSTEFATPVLFMRPDVGALFQTRLKNDAGDLVIDVRTEPAALELPTRTDHGAPPPVVPTAVPAPSSPNWRLFAAIAGAVLVIALVVAFVLTRTGDNETVIPPVASTALPLATAVPATPLAAPPVPPTPVPLTPEPPMAMQAAAAVPLSEALGISDFVGFGLAWQAIPAPLAEVPTSCENFVAWSQDATKVDILDIDNITVGLSGTSDMAAAGQRIRVLGFRVDVLARRPPATGVYDRPELRRNGCDIPDEVLGLAFTDGELDWIDVSVVLSADDAAGQPELVFVDSNVGPIDRFPVLSFDDEDDVLQINLHVDGEDCWCRWQVRMQLLSDGQTEEFILGPYETTGTANLSSVVFTEDADAAED